MLDKITSNNLSSFNIDFILKSNCNFCRHLLYFYQLRFLCSLLKIVLQFQSRHNSHTGHCYVMSFAAGKRLDVKITIMKTMQCYVSCPLGMIKVGATKSNLAPPAHLYRLEPSGICGCERSLASPFPSRRCRISESGERPKI